ncbi:MAG: beta-lactamase family protein [Candidatus Aminicenantes bacterium]|nr:beta-lactamase family protein [Candidatus Aminicenantes bacterium]
MRHFLRKVCFFPAFVLILLSVCPAFSYQQTVTEDWTEAVTSEIKSMMEAGKIPSAAVALVFQDRVIWKEAVGYANLWAGTEARTDTVYLIGSTFKAMSMFALLQQMDKGKLKLDDPVSRYLGDLSIKGENPDNPVTFRHLLTHTSGLPADFGAHSVWGDTVPKSLKEYLQKSLIVKDPPLTKTTYSNTAYTLIAFLLEGISGLPYKIYIREHIFSPLEMKDTAFIPRPDMDERLAVPYVVGKDGKYAPAVRFKADVWPAGIVYGTVEDQANWLIANLNGGVYKGHRLISEETFSEIMTRQYDQFRGPIGGGWLNDSTAFGLTWWISIQNGEKLFAHSGSVPGYTAFLAGNLDAKTGIAILTNGDKSHKYLYDFSIKALNILAEHVKKPE